jgi:hypothetical protein
LDFNTAAGLKQSVFATKPALITCRIRTSNEGVDGRVEPGHDDKFRGIVAGASDIGVSASSDRLESR